MKDAEGKLHGLANTTLEELEEDKLDILDPSRLVQVNAEEEKKEESTIGNSMAAKVAK